jgi:hypothetical protein
MTLTYQLRVDPDARLALRALKDEHPEAYRRVRAVLARLRDDPGAVRADRATTRFTNGIFATLFEGPEERRWMIAWEVAPPPPDAVDIRYVGPAPGEAPSDAAVYTSASDVIPEQI